jgi:hypothetical protein
VHGLGLDLVVVDVDLRAELDLLDLDDLLLLARLVLLLLLGEAELAVVEDLADGGSAVGTISTRSRPASSAASSAEVMGMTPCFSPF